MEAVRGGQTPSPDDYSLLNAVSSGLNSPKTPLGFGYQIQKCSVTSGGCQKLKAAPVLALVFADLLPVG